MATGIIPNTHLLPMFLHIYIIWQWFWHQGTSIINMQHLIPITILFDTGWNLIQWMISKIVCLFLFCKTSLILFYTTSVSAIMMCTITKVYVSVKSIITNTLNLLDYCHGSLHNISDKKIATSTSNNAGQPAKKFCACKKSSFNKRNCVSG